MPLYPYQCEACHHAFEEIQAMSDVHLKKCPACGRNKLARILTVPNVRVRGSAKSFGSLAEDNTYDLVQKHGAEQAKKIIHEKTYGKGGKKLKLPKGGKHIPKPEVNEIPWFRTGEIPGTGPLMEQPLDVTKIKDTKKFIMTGDKS